MQTAPIYLSQEMKIIFVSIINIGMQMCGVCVQPESFFLSLIQSGIADHKHLPPRESSDRRRKRTLNRYTYTHTHTHSSHNSSFIHPFNARACRNARECHRVASYLTDVLSRQKCPLWEKSPSEYLAQNGTLLYKLRITHKIFWNTMQ